MKRQLFKILTIYFFIFNVLFTLSGCYESDSHSDSDVTGTSSLVFNIKWNKEQLADQDYQAYAPLICEEVSSVSASIYTDDSLEKELRTGGPWDCEEKKGEIEDIPAGYNAYARIYATDFEGDIIYIGDSSTVFLKHYETVDAGLINANSFITGDLKYSALGNTTELFFKQVRLASSYRIELSNLINFNDPDAAIIYYEMNSTGNETESYLLDTTILDGTYYWRVIARDRHGLSGKSSTAERIDIKTIPPSKFKFNWLGFEACHSELDITATLYDQTNTLISTSESLSCQPDPNVQLEGIIEEGDVRVIIRAGNRVVENSFDVSYRGESLPTTVINGEITDLGEMTASSFTPELTTPIINKAFYWADPINFSWEPVEGASSYQVLIFAETAPPNGPKALEQIYSTAPTPSNTTIIDTDEIVAHLYKKYPNYYWMAQATDRLSDTHKSPVDFNQLRMFEFKLPTISEITFDWPGLSPCTPETVIEAVVYNEDTLQAIVSYPLSCIEETITISETPVDIKTKVVIYSGNRGPTADYFDVQYRGESEVKSLLQGVTAQMGVIVPTPFAPLLGTPLSNETFPNNDPITFSWEATQGVSSYNLLIYQYNIEGTGGEGFLAFEVNGINSLSYLLGTKDIDIMMQEYGTQFLFKVQAIDRYNNQYISDHTSLPSHQFQFDFAPHTTIQFSWESSITCTPEIDYIQAYVINIDTDRVHESYGIKSCEESLVTRPIDSIVINAKIILFGTRQDSLHFFKLKGVSFPFSIVPEKNNDIGFIDLYSSKIKPVKPVKNSKFNSLIDIIQFSWEENPDIQCYDFRIYEKEPEKVKKEVLRREICDINYYDLKQKEIKEFVKYPPCQFLWTIQAIERIDDTTILFGPQSDPFNFSFCSGIY